MENLIIEPTAQEAGVNFNASAGELKLWGKSFSYDSSTFYLRLKDWVRDYISSPAEETTFICFMEYVNSSSQKHLAELLFMLNEITSKGKQLHVIWKYEDGDDDMCFLGELINDEMSIPMQFKEELI